MYESSYIDYLAHLHGTRDYFECHELLEERWKKDTPLKKDAILVGFIQYAVSQYHYRRKNYKGALRTLEKALAIFSNKGTELKEYGINPAHFQNDLTKLRERIETRKPYQSTNLPINDPSLTKLVEKRCRDFNCSFGNPSNLQDPYLIHKHKNRDRTEVIEERIQALRKKTKAEK